MGKARKLLFYGTTLIGGTGTCNNSFFPGCGTVFKVDASGKETVLHNFTGALTASTPMQL